MITELIRQPFPVTDPHGAIAMPVYVGAAFEFASAEEMEDAFVGKSPFHTYSRVSNPTVEAFEQRVRSLADAPHVMALASGMAAIANVLLTITRTGDNIVASPHLFGNTFSLLYFTLKELGIETRFCNVLDTDEVARNIDERTVCVFTEIVSNPHLEVPDLNALAHTAHARNVPLIVDTTLMPWTVCRARRFGVDIEVVSSTKAVSGGATGIGGIIIDHQTFDWSHSSKLATMAKQFGKRAFQIKLRGEIARNIGAVMSPQTAYQQNLGLETLHLRFNAAANTALFIAQELQRLQRFKAVNYIALPDSHFFQLCQQQFNGCGGAMLAIELQNRQQCFELINRLKLFRRATNLFDNKSLVIHPASTIYGTLRPDLKQLVNVPDNIVRLSIGLESPQALLLDLIGEC
jgi:O-acetylhomoserine (thiol)-lyase